MTENVSKTEVSPNVVTVSKCLQTTEIRRHVTSSPYESFIWIISYLVMFWGRVARDLCSSLLNYFSYGSGLPPHIQDLLRAHVELRPERSLNSSTTNRHCPRNLNKLSDSSLEARVPSYPTSTGSEKYDLHGIAPFSLFTYDDVYDPNFENVVYFLHEDKKFLIAAETGHDILLQTLIRKGEDVQQLDSLGRNALHLAVVNGNERAVKLLLNVRVDPNVKDNVGCTPLSLCILRSPSLKLAKMLLEHGATISKRVSPTDTGLFLNFVMMSIPTEEEAKIMRLLVIEYGALLEDPQAPGGRQALHYAAMSNNCNLIFLLVELGADFNVLNHRKQTPKEVAMAFNCKEAEMCLQALQDETLRQNELLNVESVPQTIRKK